MIGKDTVFKALICTIICLIFGSLCALAPVQRPLMKSIFALSSLLFFGGTALAIPSLRKHNVYWGMFAFWSLLQAYIFFSWVVTIPFVTLSAWALTPLAYTILVALIVMAIHKTSILTPRQRMLVIMSLFLGGMHLMLGDTEAMRSIMVYFVALVIFPINVYELFHEPFEAGFSIGHTITTTLLGITTAFYLLDSIGTIMVSVNGLRYLSMFNVFEGLASGSFIAIALTYASILASIILLIYLAWAVLPRACCNKLFQEDLF